MKLNKKQLENWELAKRLAQDKLDLLKDTDLISYGGEILDERFELVTTDTEDEKEVVIETRWSRYLIYNADPDFDEGSELNKSEIKKLFSEIKIYREVV